MGERSKIFTVERMDDWVAAERAAGRGIGFTCGTFDLLHAGHVQNLSAAKAMCERLIVAVNSDDSVRRYKSALRPIIPEDQRMYVVAGLESVDAVTLMHEDRPLSLILRWKPDLYIKGGDYSEGTLRSAEAVQAYGGEVRVIPQEFASSTTQTLERIATVVLHADPMRPPEQPAKGLVLLDRDGTLIKEVPFLHDAEQVDVLPGVVEGLLKLQNAGMRLAIVTNQQGIGLGYFSVQDFIAVNQRLLRELGSHGIRISRIYFCPHSLADQCACRKPASGMIERAMREFAAPASTTWMIGDSPADMEAGQAAGCRSILVTDSGFLAATGQVLG